MQLCRMPEKGQKQKRKKKETIELWHYWDIPDNQRSSGRAGKSSLIRSQEEIEIEVSYIPDEDFKKQLAPGDVGRKDAGYCNGGFF